MQGNERAAAKDEPAQPVVGVVAVVPRDERFLLVRRGKEPNRGLWAFPGGTQGAGETITEAARRELAEETGVTGEYPSILTAFDVIDRDGDLVRHHYLLVAVLFRWQSGDGVAGDDADSVGWFGPQDLPDLPVVPMVEEIMSLTAAILASYRA